MAPVSEYERKREERIARNRELMEQLLGSAPRAFAASVSAAAGQGQMRTATPAKRKAAAATALSLEHSSLLPRRSSDRLRNKPAVVYTSFNYNDDLGDHIKSKSIGQVPSSI